MAAMNQYTSPTMTVSSPPVVTLPDKRQISYFSYGIETNKSEPSPPTILYLHGFPMSGREASHLHRLATTKGLRIIAPSRPGHSTSSAHPNFTITSVTSDLANLLSALHITKFAIFAASAGAPYALSLATVLPTDRLCAVAIFSGLYPLSFGATGMEWAPWLVLQLAYYTPSLLQNAFDGHMGRLARDQEHPKLFEQAVLHQMSSRPAVDITAVEDSEIKEAVVEGSREAVKVSSEGAMHEGQLLSMDWGFKLEDVRARTWIWHGGLDGQVPARMAEAAAKQIPDAELEVLDGEGHVSIVLSKREQALDKLKAALLSSER